ncbi:hypothetical protein BCR43DRAFT_507037 [Syncephalastrum racemosum]|uniref:Uncharacterized protein n=1 Tax=Syncephalastrum racemosum TaxID=13706 RepID=A0A1X2H5P4_SYNRA|nr:hypothetical protein BCR43DRAFT_507037 [Syncephalastrum racemosum]
MPKACDCATCKVRTETRIGVYVIVLGYGYVRDAKIDLSTHDIEKSLLCQSVPVDRSVINWKPESSSSYRAQTSVPTYMSHHSAQRPQAESTTEFYPTAFLSLTMVAMLVSAASHEKPGCGSSQEQQVLSVATTEENRFKQNTVQVQKIEGACYLSHPFRMCGYVCPKIGQCQNGYNKHDVCSCRDYPPDMRGIVPPCSELELCPWER